MSIKSSIEIAIGKRRWLKRLLPKGFLPKHSVYTFKDGRRLYLDPSDMKGPSFYIMYGGDQAFNHYEQVEKNEIVQHLKKHPGVFVDVGSNIGLFSLYVHQELPGSKIFSFEPYWPIFKCLQNTCITNQFNNISVINLALSNSRGRLPFYIDESNGGGHSINPIDGLEKDESLISTIPLDDFWTEGDHGKLSVMKIDVQGTELSVLEGAKKTIQKFSPMILVECDIKNFFTNENVYLFIKNLAKDFTCRRPGLNENLSFEDVKKISESDKINGAIERNYIFEFN